MLTSCTAFVKEWVERHYMKRMSSVRSRYHVEFFVQIEVDTTAEEAEGVGANNAITDESFSPTAGIN